MSIFAEDFSEEPWWWRHAAAVDRPCPELPDEAEVVVVGSGYAGLNCAHELAKEGSDVVVLDSGKIGIGASTRAAGLLSGRAGVSKQIDLETAVGKEHATRILDEADEAYEHLKYIVASENIDCDLERAGRFVGAHTPQAYEKLAQKMVEYNSGGRTEFYMVPKQEQRDYVASDFWCGGMFTESAGAIHSAKYHNGLVDCCERAGARLVSDARVIGISNDGGTKTVTTRSGSIRAREVVLATNGYTDRLSPWHQKRIVPISSTIVASEELGEERVSEVLPRLCPVIDTRRVVCYARPTPDKKAILFGGRARFSPIGPTESASILHQQLSVMFPQLRDIRVTNAWSGYMGFTFDFLPKVGTHEGIHYAIGCNGGCGIVMMSWLGRQAARKLMGTAQHPSAFEGLPFRSQKFYSGKPWFLPIVGNWWRLRDWVELRQAGVSPDRIPVPSPARAD